MYVAYSGVVLQVCGYFKRKPCFDSQAYIIQWESVCVHLQK